MTQYIVEFAEPHLLTDEDDRTLTVNGYDDFGSMYSLELPDGNSRSVTVNESALGVGSGRSGSNGPASVV